MNNQKSSLGNLGETLAAGFLEKNGYKVIERNHRKPWGEIDVVLRAPDGTLVFVEVKTMRDAGQGALRPEDQMSSAKMRKLRRTCKTYVAQYPDRVYENKGWRIDLVALTVEGKDYRVNHYENI